MSTPFSGKKLLNFLVSTRFAGMLMLFFAAAIGIATFIENDFGTSSAQKVVFKAWWFELMLLLFSISLVSNVVKFRMIKQKRWGLLLFHSSIVIIILGAALTRYFGYEGIMHIREGEAANAFLSAQTYLQFEVVKDDQMYRFDEPVLFATLGNNNWKESYLIGGDEIKVRVRDFIPNPTQVLEETAEGEPTIKIVIGGASGREEYFLSPGEAQEIHGDLFTFNGDYFPDAFNIMYENGELLLKTQRTLTQMTMATQQLDTLMPKEEAYPLKLRSLYSDGVSNFVFGDFKKKGFVRVESEDRKVESKSMTALLVDVTVNGETKASYVVGKKGQPGEPTAFQFEELGLAISYGAKNISVPFSLKLYNFSMEKYPGTNSAASYASEVQLIDSRTGLKEDHRIFMNNILDHDGYRFFQSSFDPDEKGTFLSVNHDFWGTWVSYLGYFLLTLGMIMSLLSKKSRFHQSIQEIKKMRLDKNALSLGLLLALSVNFANGQTVIDHSKMQSIISAEHAEKFSKLVVQDHNGRMKPVHTLTREIMRKLVRTESILDLNADQVILSMFADPRSWSTVPMIKLGMHEKIREMLGAEGELVPYNTFFKATSDTTSVYVLGEEVRKAYSLQPIDRSVYEKELMKLDEKVNIASMVYSGRFFKLIPVPGDKNNLWLSSIFDKDQGIDAPVAETFFGAYIPALRNGIATKEYDLANMVLEKLSEYQKEQGRAVMPSETKIKAEILLNELGVFNKLAFFYGIVGLLSLLLLFVSVFKPTLNMDLIKKVLFALVAAGFVMHTFGLGLRWYISGRAPWSNGYESMIYIAWTTTLAGVLFTRKSLGGLAATMVLAATVLLVAALSYLDPEITPLVPVLKSYWLTIHVSLEAGSYGFLMLGAIIGLINLILMIFLTENNKERIQLMVKEMSLISELTLTGGLFMVSVGTYLGGIWANESWGRYWGWDAKETWALIVILVYAFILHMRLIPKIQGLYAFNLATIFGWASVIMTYYGVNYYLSGLHSYAAGDPVPIPEWVYIVVVVMTIISLLAYWRKRVVGGVS